MYISIIVNCYNSEKFLKECLNSILSQSYKKFERNSFYKIRIVTLKIPYTNDSLEFHQNYINKTY